MESSKSCSWKSALLPVGTGLQMLGLALMVGGMVALGAFTAPLIFSQLPRPMAGPVMTTVFRGYDVVLMVALCLVLWGEALRVVSRRLNAKGALTVIRGVLLAALAGMMLYSTQVVNADIEHFNQAGVNRGYATTEGRRFDKVHRLSEKLYKLEVLAAVLLILMTPFVKSKAEDA